jgi:hypothetical protein
MHVLQWIAVQADSEDEAFRTVKDTLESELGNSEYSSNAWFDWFVTGGGRWNPNPDSQYFDGDQSMVISYAKDKDTYLSRVEESIQSRIDEFNNYRKSFEGKGIDLNAKLDNYTGVMNYDFELYPLKKMIDMIQGEWDFNSYFYDMHHASTNPEHMQKALDLRPDVWYLVPVDFHF